MEPVRQTGFTFSEQKDATLISIGDRTFKITRLRFRDFGADKFRDVSLDKIERQLVTKIQSMVQGREKDFKDLSEFTITLEESYGLSEADFQKGQKSHYFFDPRRINEQPTHAQLFKSGKIKCQLCYNKGGRDVSKSFNPQSEDEARETTEFAITLKRQIVTEDDENVEPNLPVAPKKPKINEGKQEIENNK